MQSLEARLRNTFPDHPQLVEPLYQAVLEVIEEGKGRDTLTQKLQEPRLSELVQATRRSLGAIVRKTLEAMNEHTLEFGTVLSDYDRELWNIFPDLGYDLEHREPDDLDDFFLILDAVEEALDTILLNKEEQATVLRKLRTFIREILRKKFPEGKQLHPKVRLLMQTLEEADSKHHILFPSRTES